MSHISAADENERLTVRLDAELASAEEDGSGSQEGFGTDGGRLGASVPIGGDIYNGTERRLGTPDEHICRGPLGWRSRRWDGGNPLRVQGTCDYSARSGQNDFMNDLSRAPALFFDPASRTITRESLLAQDSWAGIDALKGTLGMDFVPGSDGLGDLHLAGDDPGHPPSQLVAIGRSYRLDVLWRFE